jgi:hypothetical protein
MKYAIHTVVMVLGCALLTATAEASRLVIGPVIRGDAGAFDSVLALLFQTMWSALAAVPAWMIWAFFPFLIGNVLLERLKSPLNSSVIYAIVGFVLASALAVPISATMTRFMIAVEDDATTSASTRWLFDAPQLIASSVVVWVALWYLTRKRRSANV